MLYFSNEKDKLRDANINDFSLHQCLCAPADFYEIFVEFFYQNPLMGTTFVTRLLVNSSAFVWFLPTSFFWMLPYKG
jgi:hypothetical protein